MRWLFLLLVVLNVFYYVWHKLEAPLKIREVQSISESVEGRRTIQLLSEVRLAVSLAIYQKASGSNGFCIYLAGINDAEQVRSLELKLASLNLRLVRVTPLTAEIEAVHYRVAQESPLQVSEELMQGLANEFNGLIYKKSRC